MTHPSRTFLRVLIWSLACAWHASASAQQPSDGGVQDAPDAAPGDQPATAAALSPEQIALLEGLPERIEKTEALVNRLVGRVAEIKDRNTITSAQADQYVALLSAQSAQLKAAKEVAAELKARAKLPAAEQRGIAADLERVESQVQQVDAAVAALAEQHTLTGLSPDQRALLDEFPERIAKAEALVAGLIHRVTQIKGRNTITSAQADQYVAMLSAQGAQLKAARKVAADLEARAKSPAAAQGDIAADLGRVESQVQEVDATVGALTKQLSELDQDKGWSLVDKLLAARCATAICFANGTSQYWLGIEPLVELPVGISSAIGNTSLAEYINNHELRIDLAAGLRVWLFDDVVSLSVYLSKPLIDANVRAVGSDFVYPGTAVRRSFPGFALGVLFDSIWIGFDRNELRNGGSDNPMTFNSDFPPNVVVSSAWTVTIALQPVTAFRTAIGTAKNASEED